MFERQAILIVEDECFVALDLAGAVEDWNGTVIGPAATVAHALELMDSEQIAGAILDAQLADRDVTPVAMALAERGVPFVIHTGTGLPAEIEKIMPDVPVVRKPARPLVVLACLLNEIRQPGAQRLMH